MAAFKTRMTSLADDLAVICGTKREEVSSGPVDLEEVRTIRTSTGIVRTQRMSSAERAAERKRYKVRKFKMKKYRRSAGAKAAKRKHKQRWGDAFAVLSDMGDLLTEDAAIQDLEQVMAQSGPAQVQCCLKASRIAWQLGDILREQAEGDREMLRLAEGMNDIAKEIEGYPLDAASHSEVASMLEDNLGKVMTVIRALAEEEQEDDALDFLEDWNVDASEPLGEAFLDFVETGDYDDSGLTEQELFDLQNMIEEWEDGLTEDWGGAWKKLGKPEMMKRQNLGKRNAGWQRSAQYRKEEEE